MFMYLWASRANYWKKKLVILINLTNPESAPEFQAGSLQLIKKETLVRVFSCEVCEIFKNTFFAEDLRTTASVFHFMLRK